MYELNELEIEEVCGGLMKNPGFWIRSLIDGLQYGIERAPMLYSKAIDSTSEMMCRATRNC